MADTEAEVWCCPLVYVYLFWAVCAWAGLGGAVTWHHVAACHTVQRSLVLGNVRDSCVVSSRSRSLGQILGEGSHIVLGSHAEYGSLSLAALDGLASHAVLGVGVGRWCVIVFPLSRPASKAVRGVAEVCGLSGRLGGVGSGARNVETGQFSVAGVQ